MENIENNLMLDQYDKAQAFQQEVPNLHHYINPKKIQRYARPSQASRISTFFNDFDSQSNGSIPNFDSSFKKEKQNHNNNKLIQLQELKNQPPGQSGKKQEKLIVFNRQNSQVKNFYEKLTENSKIALEKINSIYQEKNNQSQSTEDLETRINSKIRSQIESLRLFYTQPCNSASIHHLKQNFYNTQLDSVFRLNSFDCHKYDQICFINNSNKIAQINFKESSKKLGSSNGYSMKDNYLSLNTDFYSSIACFNGILNNVFAYGTFTGPLISLVDIDQQKLLKSYDNPKLSEFEICTTFYQNDYQIYIGLADGNVNLYDYRMKNKMGQIFLENMQQKVKFSPVNHISLDPNNNNQLLITKPHEIILWDLRSQTFVSELCKQAYNNSDNFLKKAYFANNSKHAVVMKSSANSVGVWNLSSNSQHEMIKFEANDVVKDIQYFEDLQENIFLISTQIDPSNESPTLKNISPTLKQQIQFFAQNNSQDNQGQNQQAQSEALCRLEICRCSESTQKYERLDSIHLYNYEESDSAWNNIRNVQKVKICQNGKNVYLFSNDNVYLLDYYDRDYQEMIKEQLESHLVQEENEEGNGQDSENDDDSIEND